MGVTRRHGTTGETDRPGTTAMDSTMATIASGWVRLWPFLTRLVRMVGVAGLLRLRLFHVLALWLWLWRLQRRPSGIAHWWHIPRRTKWLPRTKPNATEGPTSSLGEQYIEQARLAFPQRKLSRGVAVGRPCRGRNAARRGGSRVHLADVVRHEGISRRGPGGPCRAGT